MSLNITQDIRKQKKDLLQYFRSRAHEFLAEANRVYGNTEFKDKSKKVNMLLSKARVTLIDTVKQKSKLDHWSNVELLEGVLMITYCNYVVMLEARNSIWTYDYMSFSRRVGELWEPFCKLPFIYPMNKIELFVPPLFSDVKKRLSSEIVMYIDKLNILEEEKNQLKKYYNKVWNIVTSGEIQLELDLHFIHGGKKYVVDFKSGFGSNEKGNTNRLLLVASIYHSMEDNYQPLIFVRSAENNNYFTTLKESGVWNAYSGCDTYAEICKYSGYDIKQWIDNNINWENDLESEFVLHLRKYDLLQYLMW